MARFADWQRIGVGCGAAMFLCMALGRFSYSTMIPALVEQGLMTAIVAGYIGGANLIGHLVGAILSISVAQRGDLRRLMAFAVWIAVIALIGSAINLGVIWLGVWRFVIGVMTGFVMVQSLALMTLHAPADRRPQAASYVFVGVGCGILFSGTAVPMLLRLGLAEAWWGVALAGSLAAAVSHWALSILPPTPQPESKEAARPPNTMAWRALVAASCLFSIGLVPHTIYWFDYIARWLGQGYDVAGAHWVAIGVFGILGPILIAALSKAVGTAIATAAIFFVLAFGVAAPAFAVDYGLIVASTVIFGIQPGVSTMIAARARDLGSAAQTPSMMRTTIVGNGLGAAVGGVLIPAMLDATGSYALLFLFGGLAFLLGGLLCLPFLNAKATEGNTQAR